jgi:hypothetical protein
VHGFDAHSEGLTVVVVVVVLGVVVGVGFGIEHPAVAGQSQT